MIQSCIILLLVAACSVHVNGASTCSQVVTATPTPSQNETATPTCSQNETATLTCSQMETAISHLETVVDMISKVKYKIPTCGDSSEVPTKKPLDCAKKPQDCADVLEMGHKKSGVYEIWPVNRLTAGKHLNVYCDMETNGGGWTVIQRRGDFQKPKDYFYRDWFSYKEGFGDIEKDFWIGNDNIFALTNQKLYSVRFDLKDFQGNKRYALYDNFWIADEHLKYTLYISNYSGDAGDSMTYHINKPFTTKGRENPRVTCRETYEGPWWYEGCHNVNLNGLYLKEKSGKKHGITWHTWTGIREYLAWTEMKIRPKDFTVSLS